MSWIYQLPKEQIVKLLQHYDTDSVGSLDELRNRLRRVALQKPEAFRLLNGDPNETMDSLPEQSEHPASEESGPRHDSQNPDLKLCIRLDSVADISKLIDCAVKIKSLLKQRSELRSAKKPANEPLAVATYNRQEYCWRCKQRGHVRFDCKRPPKRFCSRCGKDGVLTKDCHPVGNADERRGSSDRDLTRSRIIYNPRPHIMIYLNDTPIWALLDSDSDISFINEETLRTAESFGFRPEGRPSTTYLADETLTALPGNIRLPIVWEGRLIRHRFRVMPTLMSPVLIGVDLWAKIGLDLPVPPRKKH